MPASRRHHKALAVFVNCLGVIAAVPALSPATPRAAETPARPAPPPAAVPVALPGAGATPIPTGVPAVPPAVPTTGPAPVRPSMPPVSVAVGAAGTPAPGYRIEVRNAGTAPVDTMVRQELPSGSRATTVTGGGRTTRPAGSSAGEVTWRLRLPAKSTTTLHTALSVPGPGRSVTAPTCVYGTDGTRPYDCATATWVGAATAPAAQVTAAPAWRRPPVLLAAFTALLVVTAGVLWWALWRRRRRTAATAGTGLSGGGAMSAGAGAPGSGVPGQGSPAERGTVYPRTAVPAPASRRRRPPVWLVVGVAAAVLAGVVGAAAWSATQRVAAMDTTKQPTSGAWVGSSVTGALGQPLRETAFEFTVYRVSCGADVLPAAPGGGRPCLATVGVRNVTNEDQTWHGQLQRAYLPSGNWVAADEDATRVANLGRDVFSQPVAAGRRVLLPLVFTMRGDEPPKRLELRSGVFSAGVRVDVP
ncbi:MULTISPECIES: hypothetical protein [Micromonospora]|uniref:DUF4352 domain-containing protein n=1 Tax=Micromonospora chalcea TaxID=1874 RepID=A0ABX9XW09_MICCH|nr:MULTISPECIES: hypothetical protein [Micromonospora]MCK1806677.1 hypothetical protein [Micromonospora sp. R42106]MCK1831289.1 hypothetical protein [Micromonospora sp. R42003]MCK1842701.1 hypothetical protein [Micromonospora sp. R42004]MCM1017465.1 hypothetical protein [Micromonospora sp. XM-20-01]ODB80737.1 hypothetical protein A8711_19350 [Micromonospora sp. II]